MFFYFCPNDHIPANQGKTIMRNLYMSLEKTELSSDSKFHWILRHCISKDAEGGCSFWNGKQNQQMPVKETKWRAAT